jgi:hypothetical protein
MTTSVETKSVLKAILKNSAVIIAIMSALLYFHGQAFYSGYLGYWGIPEEIFPLTAEKSLTYGVNFYILLGVTKAKYFLWALLYVAVIYILAFVFLFEGPKKILLNIIDRFSNGEGDSPKRDLLGELFRLATIFAFSSLIIISFVLLTVEARNSGYTRAKTNHESVTTNKSEFKQFEKVVITYSDSSNAQMQTVGHILNSSEKFIALYATDEVILLPQANVSSMIFPEHKQD